jgi:hypothetical protein
MKMRATHQKTGQVLYFNKQAEEQAGAALTRHLEETFSDLENEAAITLSSKFRVYPVIRNYGRSW